LGKSVSIALHNLTLPGPGGESREGVAVFALTIMREKIPISQWTKITTKIPG
jgi:hypothetical protein